jgi:TolB protein
LAVVREGSTWCVDPGPVGSLTPLGGPPTPNCPAPACASASTGSTAAHKSKPLPLPKCPKPRQAAIYLVSSDGRDPRRFVTGAEPTWSPDGTELAYVTGRFLTIQGISGTPSADTIVALPTAMVATGAISNPSWSPDGDEIAFSVAETNPTLTGGERREELYAIDLDSGNLRQITTTVASASDHSPSFSPDGSEIAYAHWGDQSGIWLVRPDGTDAHPIAPIDGWVSGLSWSPDGRKILFALFATPTSAQGSSADPEAGGIYIVNADGSDLHQIVAHQDFWNLDPPTWSPDGQVIDFTAVDTATSTRAVYAVRTDGTDLRVVLREPWSIWEPTWQP